jgi:hypothetical protein
MLFGLRPWGWHLTNVLAHLTVTLLVYYLASKIIGDRLTAAVAATIFGVHPVHIEAVAWVSGVTDPSMTLLLISSFLCHLTARERQRRTWAWGTASILLYALAILAKETALVLPLLIFAYESIFSPVERAQESLGDPGTRLRNAARWAIPYLALIPPYLFVRAAALHGLSHAVTPLSPATILFTWPSLLWLYLKLLVWPLGLSPCYDTPYVTHPDLFNFFLPASAVASAALLLGVWARKSLNRTSRPANASRSRVIVFALAWLVVPILPLAHLSVLPKGDIAHDRYLYLSSVGFALLVALALRELPVGRAKLLGWPAVQLLTALGVVVLLTAGTVVQSLVWADDLLLYSRGLAVAPNNRNVKMNLAIVACEHGLYQPGIKLYKELIDQNPDFSLPYYNLGYTYYKLEDLKEADRYLSRATELNAFGANAFLYLGLTRMKLGRLRDAESLIRHAIEAAPEGAPVYHFALGVVLKAEGDLQGARDEFRAELSVDPDERAAYDQVAEVERLLDSRPSGPPR